MQTGLFGCLIQYNRYNLCDPGSGILRLTGVPFVSSVGEYVWQMENLSTGTKISHSFPIKLFTKRYPLLDSIVGSCVTFSGKVR